jgi:hypothetical protein
MWNCQFCDTEVNESSDYCPTCEYAGCTKDDHHCCDEKEIMKVWNKRNPNTPRDVVYIGRPSKWGNPFVIGKDGDRASVILKYENYLLNSPELLKQLGELRGKDLVCFCAPNACHGDVLIKVIKQIF